MKKEYSNFELRYKFTSNATWKVHSKDDLIQMNTESNMVAVVKSSGVHN